MTSVSERETIFTYGAPALKYGRGSSDEIGYDLTQYGARRVLLITDPRVAATGWPQRIADGIAGYGLDVEIFDGCRAAGMVLSVVFGRADIDSRIVTGAFLGLAIAGGRLF